MNKPEKLASAYRLLGLRENATARELKKVFHGKAMLYHPDLNPSPAAAEEFKAITNAYDLIKAHFKKNKKSSAPRIARENAPVSKSMREPFARVGDMAAGMLSAAELMFRVSNSQNMFVRMHAIRALAEQGGRDAAWCLIRALSDPAPEVCREAVAALGYMRAKFAVMPLINLHRSAAPELAHAALEALKAINSPMGRKYITSIAPHNASGSASANADFAAAADIA